MNHSKVLQKDYHQPTTYQRSQINRKDEAELSANLIYEKTPLEKKNKYVKHAFFMKKMELKTIFGYCSLKIFSPTDKINFNYFHSSNILHFFSLSTRPKITLHFLFQFFYRQKHCFLNVTTSLSRLPFRSLRKADH